MYNKNQRKYIKEAIRMVKLSKEYRFFSDGRIDYIVDLLNDADKIIKESVIVSGNDTVYISHLDDEIFHAYIDYDKGLKDSKSSGVFITKTKVS